MEKARKHQRLFSLADGVNLSTVAARTPGMVGADLAEESLDRTTTHLRE